MSHTVSIEELRAEAEASPLKKGDRVVFDRMGGIWANLVTLTGVIKKKNKDPIWAYEVEIDFPHLLGDCIDHMRKNDYITCVGPSALHALSTFPTEHLSKLNRGAGPDGFDRQMSKLVATRGLWQKILKMDEEQLERCKEALEEDPDDEWFREEAGYSEEGLKGAQERIAKETAKIETLKAKGIAEPVYSANG